MSDDDRATQVLLVEDNDGDAFLVAEALEEAVEDGSVVLRRVRDLAGALAVLEEGDPPGCVLLDLGLPDVVGDLEALTRVLGVAPSAAVVVLTGSTDHELAGRAVASGAQDYLVKTGVASGAALLRAIRFADQRARAVAELRTTRDELAEFAKRVAHDLRAPLASIVGFASVLLGDQMTPDEATRDLALRRIAEVSNGMARMVDSMLTYAQEAGTVRTPVQLDDVVDWVTPLLISRLEAADAEMVREDLGTVWANEPALRTVVLNLLSNAVKYRSPERRLRVRVWSVDEGDRVVLHVEDNGLGIPVEARDQVFLPGHRLLRVPASDGVGLGLSAVHRIVQQLDGEAWIEDPTTGQAGVRLCVALPSVAAGQAALAEASDVERPLASSATGRN